MSGLRAAFLREDGALRAGWWVLLGLGALRGAPFLVFPLLGGLLRPPSESILPWEGLELLGILVATAFCLALRREGPASLGFRLDGRWAREAALGFLGGLLLMGAGALLLRALGGFHWTLRPGAGAWAMASGFLLYLLAALGEELTFRGFVFQRLLEGLGTTGALLLGGLWFAWAHWENPGMDDPVQRAWALLNIALAGVFLALAYLRTRSLALPVGLHLGWNWMQGSVLGFAVSGTTDYLGPWQVVVNPARASWFHGGSFGLEASVFGTGACLVAIVALGFWKGVSADASTDGAR